LNLSETIKEGGRGASSGAGFLRLRDLLVVAETALSVVLLAGAGLMLRSFDKLLGTDPGFNPESVLTLRVPLPVSIKEKPRQAAYYSRMLERVQRLPGMNAAGLITPLPLGDVDTNATFAVEGRPAPAGEQQLVKLRAVSAGYFRAMGVGLRRGRLFNEGDGAEAPAVVVVNESLARRYFPMEDPVGRRVGLSGSPKGPWFTIVGVVNDVKYLNLRDDGSPEMYRDYRQFLFAPFAVTLALRTGADDPMRLAAKVQKEIRAVNPDQTISDVKPMRQVISENVSQLRFYTLLLSIFAAMAVLLAAAGLYGVLAHAVSGRVREIGIRIALGASPGAILGQVVGHALALVAAGIGIGLAAACALTRLIAAQLFQVSPTDPLTFAGVSVVLAAVAAAASFLPARRAVTVSPVAALRCQ
jgi:putative ABC transport system permease protein